MKALSTSQEKIDAYESAMIHAFVKQYSGFARQKCCNIIKNTISAKLNSSLRKLFTSDSETDRADWSLDCFQQEARRVLVSDSTVCVTAPPDSQRANGDTGDGER